jgi:hypothetical protein
LSFVLILKIIAKKKPGAVLVDFHPYDANDDQFNQQFFHFPSG